MKFIAAIKKQILKQPYIYAAVAVAVAYYFFDATMMAYFFEEDGLWKNIVDPTPDDIWMRGSISVILIVMGLTIQRANHTLHQRERALAEAQRMAHVGSWEWDMASGKLVWSDETYRIFGYEPGKIKPNFDDILACIPPEDIEQMDRVRKRAFERGQDYEFEHRIIRPDGSIRHVLSRGEVYIRDRRGDPLVLRGSMLDITEHKLVEEELKKSEAWFRTLANACPSLVSYVNADRVYEFVNETYQKWFDTPAKKIVGRSVRDVHGEKSYEHLRPRIDAVLAGQELEFQTQILNSDGETRSLQGHLSPDFDADGKARGYFVYTTDVTELRKSEEQLRQSQKMEAIGQLTGGVAHEFNNLLMVITGNLEAMEEKLSEDDELLGFIAPAKKSAWRGAALTQSLLAFSRKQSLELKVIDLNRFVLEISNMLVRTLGETITIETELAEDLWHPMADSGQIEAALLNIALNARDAMPDGGTITVRTSNMSLDKASGAGESDQKTRDYVALEVTDTGCGMDADQIEHIFEPFYTTKEVGEGTGLGLSIVYGFARQSGGFVEAESEPGKGTTIRLCLPRAAPGAGTVSITWDRSDDAVRGGGTILVVEDEPEVRNLVASQLKALGYRVIEAEDGPAALASLEGEDEIDLLFTDLILPGGMSGREIAIRALKKHNGLKILFTSGYPDKEIRDVGLEASQIQILRKPYRRADLAALVADALAQGARGLN